MMKQPRPWLPTAILLGVAVLLAIFSILIVPKLGAPRQSDSDQPTPVVFFEFIASDIVEISVTQGFLMTTVERVGSEWRIASPAAGAADTARLDDLALRISGMRSIRALESVIAADFGLGESAAQVALGLADGRTILFSVGDENPGGTGHYVQRPGDSRVHIVPIEYVGGLLELTSNPPYPPTPTPPPSPVETPTPETEEALTPEAEESPTPTP
jgi:hypothetical protein